MQVAKLFASLGFKIDTADLSHFESLLNKAQGEMSQFAKDLNFVNQKLKTMKNRFGQANDALKDTNIAKAADRVAKAVDKYVKNAKEIVDIDSKVERVFKDTGVRLDLLSNKLDGGTSAWNRYEQQVKEATARMKEFTAAARERQSVNPPRGTGAGSGANQGGGGGNAGGRGSGSRGNNGVNDPNNGTTVLAGARQFGKAFVGQLAFGGLLGSGYIIKEIVQSGREVIAMEQKLKAVSQTAGDFANNMQYVRETSKALAIDISEFGNSFSSIYQSAKGSTDIAGVQQMYTNFNKYFKAMQMTPDQIKGSLRAVGQMFNKQQVMAEELKNQLGERAAGTIQIFAEYAGYGSGAEGVQKLFKAMEAGKVGVQEILKASDGFGKLSNNNNALAESLKMSASKQIQFTSAMKQFAATIMKSGLDKGLANLFTGLEKIVLILTPFVVGLFAVIGGLFQLFALLLSFDWWVYAGIVAAALAIIVAGFYSIGGAALVAEVAAYSLAAAMRVLSVAFPIVGLITLIGLLGVYKSQQDKLQDGSANSTWIDLWVLRLSFFFLLMKKGWLITDIAIANASLAIKDFFSTDPPDWFKKHIQGQTLAPKTTAFNSGMGDMKNFSDTTNNQNLSIPVDVYLTIQNPDGSTYQARASKTPIINVGALGIVT